MHYTSTVALRALSCAQRTLAASGTPSVAQRARSVIQSTLPVASADPALVSGHLDSVCILMRYAGNDHFQFNTAGGKWASQKNRAPLLPKGSRAIQGPSLIGLPLIRKYLPPPLLRASSKRCQCSRCMVLWQRSQDLLHG